MSTTRKTPRAIPNYFNLVENANYVISIRSNTRFILPVTPYNNKPLNMHEAKIVKCRTPYEEDILIFVSDVTLGEMLTNDDFSSLHGMDWVSNKFAENWKIMSTPMYYYIFGYNNDRKDLYEQE